jgi:hypothetical protein
MLMDTAVKFDSSRSKCCLEFIKWVRAIEPIKTKLRRWFLNEDNYIPDSIKEALYYTEDVKLSLETINALSEFFLQVDRDLHYGMTKRFLYQVYSKAGCFETEKDKHEFYGHSTYRKKVRL